jgi:alkylation response protein AidB-like acyl-CoA dehydrogenase
MATEPNPAGLYLDFNENQDAIRAAVDRFCLQNNVADIARQTDAGFPRELWRDLAGVGVFYPAAPGYDAGGALELCAIAETLGDHVFPGPVAATCIAIQVLDEENATGLVDGTTLVSLSSADSTLLPYGTEADLYLIADMDGINLALPPKGVEPVATLGGETWGRALLKVDKVLPDAGRGLLIGNIVTAAYLVGAAWRLLRDASDYAATRKQFGKTLGEFQAVTHPLADCAIGLTGTQTLARAAACNFDNGDIDEAERLAAGALVAARRASLKTAFACHQVFAGIGVTLEGPAFHISRRIRQLASSPPTGAGELERLLADAGLGV